MNNILGWIYDLVKICNLILAVITTMSRYLNMFVVILRGRWLLVRVCFCVCNHLLISAPVSSSSSSSSSSHHLVMHIQGSLRWVISIFLIIWQVQVWISPGCLPQNPFCLHSTTTLCHRVQPGCLRFYYHWHKRIVFLKSRRLIWRCVRFHSTSVHPALVFVRIFPLSCCLMYFDGEE